MQVFHNETKKGSGKKRPREKGSGKKSPSKDYYNEFDDSDDDTKKRKFNPDKTPPPLPGSKPSKAKGPDTPSPPTDKRPKYSEPDSTPPSNQRGEPAVTGQKGVKRCLSDLIETDGKMYIRRLEEAARLSENEIDSAEELAKNGATLWKHGETIQKLGNRLISTSKKRFDEFIQGLPGSSSTDLDK